jgi:hypothetical protein
MAAIISARLNPKVYFDVLGRLLNRIAMYVIIIAIPSLKLCIASEIRDKLPEISPPITSAIVIKKFSSMVMNRFFSEVSLV